MESSEATPTVKVGQVWEAYERRRVWVPGVGTEIRTTVRTLQVLELVDRSHTGNFEQSVRCHCVQTGRKVVVAIRRMKPGKTRGYRLVHDANQ